MTGSLDAKNNCNSQQNVSLYIKSIFTLTIATFAFSLVPILYRISEDEISAEATIFNRFWITVLLLGSWKAIRSSMGNHESTTASESPSEQSFSTAYILLFSLGAIYFCFQLSWSQSLLSTSVANSTVLHNMTPIFVVAYECLFMRHQLKLQRLTSIATALVGIFILEFNGFHLAGNQIVGDALALLSAVCNACYLLVAEKLQKYFDIVSILLAMSAINAVIALIVLLIEQKALFPVSFYGWASVAAVAVLSQILGNVLLISSLNVLSPYFVALFLLLDPMLSSVEAWIFFNENLDISQYLGFFVITGSIVIAASNLSGDKAEI